MAKQQKNIYQKLTSIFGTGQSPILTQPSFQFDREQILKTDSREDFEAAKLQAQQTKYIADKWTKLDQSLYSQAIYYEPNRIAAYYDFESMEYSLHGDTKIATPDGFITIKELADKGRDYEFITYSYDHNLKKIVPAKARNAHYTRDEMTYKITFDDDTHIIATYGHRFLKRDGTFEFVENLKKNDSMMPFYRKSFYNNQNYNWIYTCNSNEDHHDWVLEHSLITEWSNNRKLNKEVYHIDFKLSFNEIIKTAKKEKTLFKTAKALNVSYKKIQNELKFNGYKNWNDFLKIHKIKKLYPQVECKEEINFNFIPWDLIVETAGKYNTMQGTANKLNITINKLRSTLRNGGYNNWTTFIEAYGFTKGKLNCKKNNVINHKIKKIEPYGVVPVYDITVPGYKNFATDTIISHNTPEISAALDIYSEESTTMSEKGEILNIHSDSKRVKGILDNLFYDILDINTNLQMWVRGLCKYGDNFVYLKIDPQRGIIGCQQLPNVEIERLEGASTRTGNEYGKVNEKSRELRFNWKNRDMEMQSWEVAHFRLLGDDRRLPYGTSMLDKIRRIWKQLLLAEDAMLIYRTSRAPERRVFKIFVGNMDDIDIEPYVQRVANKFKRDQIVDSDNGQVDMRYNQMAVDQDYFIPVRDPNQTNPIETLPGATNLGEITDIEYIQKKMLAALRIPKAFLGFEEVVGEGKGLALMDIRFARTINRIQKSLIQELNKIALIHLFMLGMEDELTNFTLSLTNPSSQSDLLKIEQWKEKITLYKDATSDQSQMGILPVSHTWGKRNILGFSDDEVLLDFKQQRLERAIGAELIGTAKIIRRSGIFDGIDKKYGIPENEREKIDAQNPTDTMGIDGESSNGFSGIPSAGLNTTPEDDNNEDTTMNEEKISVLDNMLSESINNTSLDLFKLKRNQANIDEINNKINKILKE